MDRFALSLRCAALALAASLAAPALAHEETHHHHHDHHHGGGQDGGQDDWARHYITLGFAEGSDDCSIDHNYEAVHDPDLRGLYRYGSHESFCPEKSFAVSYGHRFHRNWGLEIGQIRGPEVETEGNEDDGHRYQSGYSYYHQFQSRPLPYSAQSEAVTAYAAVTFFFGTGTGFQPYLMAGKARREFTLSHLCPVPGHSGKYEGHYRLYSREVEMKEEVPIRGLGAFIGLGKTFGLRISYRELPDQDIEFYGAEFSFSF